MLAVSKQCPLQDRNNLSTIFVTSVVGSLKDLSLTIETSSPLSSGYF